LNPETQPSEDLFSVLRAGDLPKQDISRQWLIEGLWSSPAVGVVAGSPKSGKSWLALEMALSVASATPCLEQYDIHDPGPALIYMAEDSLGAVRERLEALTSIRRIEFETLDLHAITSSSMRLDLARDQIRLLKTVRALKPRLLVLDPLVRIHRLDENSAHEISGLLAYLRELHRELDLSIVLVHHTRKNASSKQQAGQGLRGSGDIHAWLDSSLYLRRQQDKIILSIEHRSAPTPNPIVLQLVTDNDTHRPRLRIIPDGLPDRTGSDLDDQILSLLESRSKMTRSALRDELRVKNERLGRALITLQKADKIERSSDGWKLAASTPENNIVPRSPP